MRDSERPVALALQMLLREIRRHQGQMPPTFDGAIVRAAEDVLGEPAPVGMNPRVRERMAEAFLELGPMHCLMTGTTARIYGPPPNNTLLWTGETSIGALPGDRVNIQLPDGRMHSVEVWKDHQQ